MEKDNFKSFKRFKSIENISDTFLSAPPSGSRPRKVRAIKNTGLVSSEANLDDLLKFYNGENSENVEPKVKKSILTTSSALKDVSDVDLSFLDATSSKAVALPTKMKSKNKTLRSFVNNSFRRLENMEIMNFGLKNNLGPAKATFDLRSLKDYTSNSFKRTNMEFEIFATRQNVKSTAGRYDITTTEKVEVKKKVIESINDSLKSIEIVKFHFYAGITTRPSFDVRLSEHSNLHNDLKSQVLLANFKSFAELCYAEAVAIEFLRNLAIEAKIKSCWNKTDGFDIGTINAKENSRSLMLYILWAETLDEYDNTIGSLGRKRFAEERVEGKFWSLTSSVTLNADSSEIERHIQTLIRKNVECDLCKRKFINVHSLNLHTVSAHKKDEDDDFICSLCSFEGSVIELRKHIQVRELMKTTGKL